MPAALRELPATSSAVGGRSSRWPLLVALLLAGALLFLAFRGVDWREVLDTVRRAHLEYLAAAWGTLSATTFLRALRWRLLLGAEKPVPRRTVFWATAVGYLANSFLPARAGELLRSVMLGRAASISSSFALATTLTERALDAVVLVLISLVAVTTLEGLPEWLFAALSALKIAALAAVVGLFAAPRLEGLLRKGLVRLPQPEGFRARLLGTMGQFLLGMRAFQHTGRALRFAAFTGVIWLLDSLGTMAVARALELTLTLPQALLLLAALGLSSAAPSTPGYVGIYQFVAVTLLVPFGFSQSEALAYIIVVQAGGYGVVTAWGLIGLWRLAPAGLTLRQVGGARTRRPGSQE